MQVMKTISLYIVSAFIILGLFGTVAHAQTQAGRANTPLMGPTNTPLMGPTTCTTPACQQANGNQSQSVPLNIHLNNPLSGVSTIPDAINKIVSIVIRVALPIIILFFIWSGLSFIFARGNPEKVKTAKNMFLFTVIGTLLILGAWAITNAIIGTVNAIIT
jgi:hypothetical protein